MDAIKKVINVFDKIAIFLMSAIIVAMTVCLVLLIFGRNFFYMSFPGAEEISRFCLVWVTFLGASVAYKRNEHMAFDFLLIRMPDALQRVVKIIREFILFGLAFIMMYYGLELVSANIHQISMQAMIPMGFVYVVIPVTGVLMLAHASIKIIGHFKGETEVVTDRIITE